MIKTPCCRDDSWTAIPLGKFVPFAILRSYLQPNVEWQMNCIFNGGSYPTTVYIRDEQEALLFKLKFFL